MAGLVAGLEGLGMGLGQFAQNYQRQQQQDQQTQLLKMKIAEFLRNKYEQQQEGALGWAGARAGMGGDQPAPIQPLPSASPPMGMGGGMGGAPSMPSPPPPPPSFGPPVGGMARGGMATPRNPGDAAVASLPGANFPTVSNPNPSPPQWTGTPDPSIPPPSTEGPPPASPPPAAAQSGGDPTAQIDLLSNDVHKLASTYDVSGKMSNTAVMQAIEKSAPPGTPDYIKFAALEKSQKVMAPYERQQWERFKMEHDDVFKNLEFQIRQHAADLGERRLQAMEDHQSGTGWQILPTGDPKAPFVRANPGQNKVEPFALPASTTKMGSTAQTVDPKAVEFTANAIARYDMAPLGGWAMRGKYGQDTMARVYQINPDYDQTKYGAKARGAVAMTTGRQGDTIRTFSVSIDHLATMDEAAQALQNGDVQALNRIQQRIAQEFGYEGPVDFNFVKSIVGDEVAKAVIGGVGASADRQQLQDGFNRANSPEQLAGVSRMAKKLIAGQLGGLRRQAGTAGMSETDFEKALSPRAKAELEHLGGGGGGMPTLTGPAPNEAGGAGAPVQPSGEVIQNGWRYDAKTHAPIGPVQQ